MADGGAGQEEFRPQKQQGSSEEGIWGWKAYDDEFVNAAEKAGLSLAYVSRNLYRQQSHLTNWGFTQTCLLISHKRTESLLQ